MAKDLAEISSSKSKLPSATIRYAEGDGVNLGDATNVKSSFHKLSQKVSKPVVTRETFAAYSKSGDAEKHRLKRIAGWMIRCPITGGKRTKDSVEPGRLITLDIDKATPQFAEDLLAGKVFKKWTFIAHTTRSHTPENPRFRIILLADKPIGPDDYQRVVRILSQNLDPDMEVVDKVSARVAQLMYMPSCSADMEKHFIHYEQVGAEVDWGQVVADWEEKTGADSTDITKLPRYRDEDELREVMDKVEDPLLKKGPVGFFCRAYTISELVTGKDEEEPILEGIYEVSEWGNDGSPKRLSYLLGHSQNGVVLYNDDTLCYSHHGSDPAADRTLNAFDLVRIHKFGEADDDLKAAPNARKSYKDMVGFAKGQPAYKRQMGLDKYDMAAMLDDADDSDWVEEETAEDLLGFDHVMAAERQKGVEEIDDLLGVRLKSVVETGLTPYERMRAEKPPKDWIASELELDQNGQIKGTLTNAAIIIGNNSRLWRKIAHNDFSNQVVLLGDVKTRNSRIPPLTCRDKRRGDNWQDYNDLVIRAIMEGPAGPGLPGYGMTVQERNLMGAVSLAAKRNSFHPVKDMIARWRGIRWDGVDRISTFLHRHLYCEDSIYVAECFKLMLIASIARIETPGCKFDYALIFQGNTGIGKSTLIKILYGEDYFGELDANLGDRQEVAEQIGGKWALELPELGGLSKTDYNHAKIFMRKQDDDVRMVYARRNSELPRQCVVYGTTNEESYLKDPNGNRSYWIVKTGREAYDAFDIAEVLQERDQLWAQAIVLHDQMRAKYPTGDMPLTLTGEALRVAQIEQENARIKQPHEEWKDILLEWFDRPTHKGSLLADLGIEDPNSLGLDDEQDYVRRAFFTQEQALTALGFKRPALNHLDNMEWVKMVNALKNDGWLKGRHRVAHGIQRMIYYPKEATADDFHLGYRPVGAEPTQNGEADNYDDLL